MKVEKAKRGKEPQSTTAQRSEARRLCIVLCISALALAYVGLILWAPHVIGSGEPTVVTSAAMPEKFHTGEGMRRDGRCDDCHKQEPQALVPAVESKIKDMGKEQAVASFPARDHSHVFMRVTHGTTPEARPSRCLSCHHPRTCKDCHEAQVPTSHTLAFRKPSGLGDGSALHAALGRIRPGNCLACHGSLQRDCAGCHMPRELDEIGAKGRANLAHWPQDCFPGVRNAAGGMK